MPKFGFLPAVDTINKRQLLERRRNMMPYTGLELFMEKLKQLIYCNGNPLINNHPSVLSQRPQIQLLYEDLGSIIQTLFVDQEPHHELPQVTLLKKILKDAAEEVHDIVDLFVFNLIRKNRLAGRRSHVQKISLNLEDVMRSIKSIKENVICLKKGPSLRTVKTQSGATAAGTSNTRKSLGSKELWDEIVVGLDNAVDLIRDKLVECQKQPDVVSIVGMGGLGKTTLATKVYNDPYIVYYFDVRAWVTVSQAYEKRDSLIKILASIEVEVDPEITTISELHGLLHRRLLDFRYLIVIDDIWSIEAWDELKVFFPNNLHGSRILLTSRLKEVASHAKPHGFIHHLSSMTEKESWELLQKKVFHGDECPEWLIKPGMQIARNCHGLPLACWPFCNVLKANN